MRFRFLAPGTTITDVLPIAGLLRLDTVPKEFIRSGPIPGMSGPSITGLYLPAFPPFTLPQALYMAISIVWYSTKKPPLDEQRFCM